MDDRLQRVEAELKEARTGIARMTILISLFMLTLIALVVVAAMATDIFKVEYNGTTRFQVDQQGTTTINADSSSPDVALKIISASTSRGDMKFSVRAADPTAPGAGDLWYNSTENRYKLYDGSFKRYVLFDLPQVVDDGSTVNNNYGTRGANAVVGSDDPTWTTDAQLGGCTLSFDGTNDYVSAGDVSMSGSFTMEGWVKFNAVGVYNGLFGKGKSSGYAFVGLSSSNTLRFLLRNEAGTNIFDVYTIDTYATGIWYHVAAAHDNTSGVGGKLYVNGVSKASSTATGAYAFNAGIFDIGRLPNVVSWQLNGSLDEVAIWNVALTPAQISARYNGGAGAELVGNEAGLVSVWHPPDRTIKTCSVVRAGMNDPK